MPCQEPWESSASSTSRFHQKQLLCCESTGGSRKRGFPLHASDSQGTHTSPQRRHQALKPPLLAHTRWHQHRAQQPWGPSAPTTAQGQPRDQRKAHLKSSRIPAPPLHFSSDGLSAVTFPTAIDRKHFIAFPGGRILGVGLISVSMVTSSGLMKDLAFLGCCWVVETGGGGGLVLYFLLFRFSFFFNFFNTIFSVTRKSAARQTRCLQLTGSAAARWEGPQGRFHPQNMSQPPKPIEARMHVCSARAISLILLSLPPSHPSRLLLPGLEKATWPHSRDGLKHK